MSPEDRAAAEALGEQYIADLHAHRLSYRIPEAARLLGVDERTVRRLIASGRIRAVRESSRLTLVPRASLYDFLGLDQPERSQVAAR